jgi:hypothetical protein
MLKDLFLRSSHRYLDLPILSHFSLENSSGMFKSSLMGWSCPLSHDLPMGRGSQYPTSPLANFLHHPPPSGTHSPMPGDPHKDPSW